MKTNLLVRPKILAIRFNEKSFFNTILGFTPHWDFKSYNDYISQKTISLSTIDEIHLKADVIVGSLVCGQRQPILFSFILDTPSGYKVFYQPERVPYKKINLFWIP